MAINQPGFRNLNKPGVSAKPNTVATADPEPLTPLERMEAVLTYVGYQTINIPVSADNIAERLLVTLDPLDEDIEIDLDEEEKQELLKNSPLIQIMFLDELVQNPKEDQDKFTPSTLQFYIALPFQIGADKLWESYRLLAIISQFVHIGNFGMDNNGVVFYRYSFFTQKKEIDSILLVEIIQTINFFIKKFTSKILDFASGAKTLDEVIGNIEMELLPKI